MGNRFCGQKSSTHLTSPGSERWLVVILYTLLFSVLLPVVLPGGTLVASVPGDRSYRDRCGVFEACGTRNTEYLHDQATPDRFVVPCPCDPQSQCFSSLALGV